MLGKDTEEKQYLRRKINTLPVLLEDKKVMEAILREAGCMAFFL